LKLGKFNCRAPIECKSNDDVGFVYREIPQQLSSGQDLWHNLYLFMSSFVTETSTKSLSSSEAFVEVSQRTAFRGERIF
jgi:hypothetical protein